MRLDRTTSLPLLRIGVEAIGSLMVAFLVVIIGFGWLYFLRQLGWFGVGPRIGDSLPLLQLAEGDGQPLLRVIIAWALTGVLGGVTLSRTRRRTRTTWIGTTAVLLLLVGSQAAFAVTRNEAFGQVLFGRMPGLGSWLEAALLVITLGAAPQHDSAEPNRPASKLMGRQSFRSLNR